MSSGGFERLLYTDCRAGEGRGGGGGFQIQAQSAGTNPTQSRTAVKSLLYAVQDSWIAERRPVKEFPLGFAHYAEGGYGTAQSRYLGKEVNGGRSGNHLADCLLACDGDPYGAIRPAQLWRSSLWRDSPWDSTVCPAFDGFLETGPLSNKELADWLRLLPGRELILKRLLSTLEQSDGARVVISADDPEGALRWIAAATLLLPMRQALEISFKVFVSNLNQASQRIAAAPKILNPQLLPRRNDSRFILDATTDTSDDCPVTARASYWVERFATNDDPYDVVDAVELAYKLDGINDEDRYDACQTAWAIIATDEPIADPSALARWLTTASPAAVDLYGSAVAVRMFECELTAEVLRWIDGQAAVGQLQVDRAITRSRLLVEEVEEARMGSEPPPGVLDPVDLGPVAQRDAQSVVASAIVLEPDDGAVDRMLRVARRHRISLPLASVLDRLQSFVAGWVHDPDTEYLVEEWALQEEILDVLHAEVTHSLAERGLPAVMAILRIVWPRLLDRTDDFSEPLNWQLHAAALTNVPQKERYKRIKQSLANAEQVANRTAALDGIQQAMIEWNVVGEQEAMMIATLLPMDVDLDISIAQFAASAAESRARRPDILVLNTVYALEQRRQLPHTGALAELLRSDRCVADLVDAAAGISSMTEVEHLRTDLRLVRDADPVVIRVWLPALLNAALDSLVPSLGSVLMLYLPDPLPMQFLECWARELDGPNNIRAALVAVTWYESPRLSREIREKIAQEISGLGQRLSPERHNEWIFGVHDRLTPDQSKTWAALAAAGESRPRRSRRFREKDH